MFILKGCLSLFLVGYHFTWTLLAMGCLSICCWLYHLSQINAHYGSVCVCSVFCWLGGGGVCVCSVFCWLVSFDCIYHLSPIVCSFKGYLASVVSLPLELDRVH